MKSHVSSFGVGVLPLRMSAPIMLVGSFMVKEYDATGPIYSNARYYDPTTGRFFTEDPSRKGVNWYAYCENNPVNVTDPTGRQSVDQEKVAARPTGLGVAGAGGMKAAQPPGAPRSPAAQSPVVPQRQAQTPLVPAPPGSDAFFIPQPSGPETDNRFQAGLGLSGNVLSLGGAIGLTTSGPYAGSQEVHRALFGFSGDLTLSAKGNTEISIGAGFLSKYLSVGVVLDNPDVGSVKFRGINVHVGAGVGLPYAVSKELP